MSFGYFTKLQRTWATLGPRFAIMAIHPANRGNEHLGLWCGGRPRLRAPLVRRRRANYLNSLRDSEPRLMPLLELERFISPEDLLELPGDSESTNRWWVLHTRPRAEKSLVRKLCDRDLSFYLPLHSREWINRGRRFQSHLPLFPGYVFLYGDFQSRLTALSTNLIAHTIMVEDQEQLVSDLARVHHLLSTGAAVTPEDRLEPGDPVEIIRGPLAGLEGKLLRRGGNLKFVIEVQFLRRAVSAEVECWMIKSLDRCNTTARAG